MRYLLYIMLTVILSGCMDFSIDEKEMQQAFDGEMYQPESNTLSIDSSQVHYVYIDNNRPNLVVFIHGSPGSWSAFIDYFKNDTLLSHFDVLAIDRPGFGMSDKGTPEPSLERQAFLISEVIKLFAQPKVIMVGHSLGGPVIARVAMDNPELVDGLLFLAPSIDPEQEKYEWYRSWIETKVGGWLTPTDFWVSNEEILPLKAELEKMLPLWENISVPSIVIQGTKDNLVPKENAEFARRMLNDSLVDIRYIDGANHFIPWTYPEWVVKGIIDLKKVD